MSGAIVAKSINDSLGTDNFKGLNTILREELTGFNDMLRETLVDFVNEQKAQAPNGLIPSSNVYWVFQDRNKRLDNNTSVQLGESVVVNYDGAISLRATGSVGNANTKLSIYCSQNGTSRSILTISGTSSNTDNNIGKNIISTITMKVSKGDVLRINANVSAQGGTASLDGVIYGIEILAEMANLSGISVQ